MVSVSAHSGSDSDRKDLLDLLMARLAVLLGDDVLERDRPADVAGTGVVGTTDETAGTPGAPGTADQSNATAATAPGSPHPADARTLLESIVFACLAESTDDERVVSLMHTLGWPAHYVCCSVAGTPRRTMSLRARHQFGADCRPMPTVPRRIV